MLLSNKSFPKVLAMAIVTLFSTNHFVLIHGGFCNWGPDGTATTSVCEGGAQGGDWCNANQNHCESGCEGKWCTAQSSPGPAPGPNPGCGEGWSPASWTTYTSYAPCCEDSPNYDPNADTTECTQYSACSYTGDFAYIAHKSFDFVKSNNLIAFFSTFGDNTSFGNKQIRIADPVSGRTIEALVADTCGDDDCDGCCTDNASPSGYLVDMEYHTVVNNFGYIGAASGQVCWQLVGGNPGGTPDNTLGFCNWGADGTGASSVCQGGAQGGEWCNANQNQCESGCGGKWCT